VADKLILLSGTSALPLAYTVPNATEIIAKAACAAFDGSAAASSYEPTLEIVSDGGIVLASVPAQQLVAGDSATVTWAPFLRGPIPLSQITPPIQPRVKLFDYTLPANATSIDTLTDGTYAGLFPTTYDVIECWVSSRLSRATIGATIAMTFNNDSGANYRRNFLQVVGTGVSAISVAGQNYVNVDTHGDAGSATTWGQASFEIFGYALTDRQKTGRLVITRPVFCRSVSA